MYVITYQKKMYVTVCACVFTYYHFLLVLFSHFEIFHMIDCNSTECITSDSVD